MKKIQRGCWVDLESSKISLQVNHEEDSVAEVAVCFAGEVKRTFACVNLEWHLVW